jgi:hypothetical protein
MAARDPHSAAVSDPREVSRDEPVQVRFHNVHLRIRPGIVLEVRDLEGALVSTRPGQPPVFDDQRSFALRVDAGRIAISPESLTRILNEEVFAGDRAPISNVRVTIERGRLKQTGTLRKVIRLPFTVEADVSTTPDGRIRLHPASVKAAGIPAGRVMRWLGIELEDLVKSNPGAGLEVVDNDLLLAPDRLIRTPEVRGRLRGIRIEPDRIVQIYGAPRTAAGRGNYMAYRGGTLRFGRLTMSDTDMTLVDADPADPFDFWPDRYSRQLVAGYSKNTAAGGLRVYMPDYAQAAATDLRP